MSSKAPSAKQALLEAIARGRIAPRTPQVRPLSAAPPRPEVLQGLHVEELQLCSEEGAASVQAWVPARLVKQPPGDAAPQPRLPVVLLLHATGHDMGSLAAQQARFARRGCLAVAMDCRYHGARSAAAAGPGGARLSYEQALVAAWRGSGERPFLLDNVWDVHCLLDYLEQRPDVDASRIGMTGVSLGGMHTWLAAAADERVAAAAPMIGVQWFGWAVQHRRYQARVDSIPLVFQAAADDLAAAAGAQGQAQQQEASASASVGAAVTPEIVAAVWDRLLPGMREHYDAPQSLPLLAPRPLLIANGELDPRCPMQGVEPAVEAARAAYARLGAADALQLYVEPGCGHECTEGMWAQVFAFMDRHLLGN